MVYHKQKAQKARKYDFDIDMETGTGKTHVYLRTILELRKNYGFSKFIIVVPSIAVGVYKSLEITKAFFRIYLRIQFTTTLFMIVAILSRLTLP